ncbi:HNH endonuclease signature motif containing protein [Glutamicibacter sp. AOP5-A2-18]|uniref:HNH endonuclease signature motif containing protein n=1 Tax=Glutamicibacter sp. AOP5-A2-18 TaxID=3457656 RepID=UPI0040335AF0
MRNPEFVEDYDDEHRLPLHPAGTRRESHLDSVVGKQVDHQLYNGPMKKLANELFDAGPVNGPGDALDRLGKVQRLKSSLDALTSTLLADSVEQVGTSFAEVLATQYAASPEEVREAQRSAEFYGVDPSDDQVINSNFIAEAAIVLRESPRKVSKRMFTAKGLRHVCKDTLIALAAGEITRKAAQHIIKFAQDLSPDQIATMERVLLPVARTANDDVVYQRARRYHDRMNPEAAAERHKKSEAARKVTWWEEENGMGCLKLYHRVDVIESITHSLRWATDQINDPKDGRTQDQILADVYADAMINGWPGAQGTPLKPRLSITIPALEMLVDPTKALADLEGYGPIPVGLAVQLAKDAPSFQRVLTDPWTGAVIDVERRNYRPSQAMKDLLRLRDVHCCFPGCRRSADRSEIDHIDDWAHGGNTNRENTHLLCKQHQMFKHALGWKVVARPDGTRSWVSPHGVNTIVTSESVNIASGRDHLDDHGSQRPHIIPLPLVEMNPEVDRVLGYPMNTGQPATQSS